MLNGKCRVKQLSIEPALWRVQAPLAVLHNVAKADENQRIR